MSASTWAPEQEEDLYRAGLFDLKLMGRLLRYAWGYPGRLAVGSLLVAFSSVLALAPPLLYGALVDVVFAGGRGAPGRIVVSILSTVAPIGDFGALSKNTELLLFAGLFLFVHLGTFLVDWGNGYLLAGLGQHVVYDIRTETFRHIHELSFGWFSRTPVGRLVTRVANDAGALEEMFGTALVTIFKDVGMLAGMTAVMLAVDLRVGLIALSILPPLTAATIVFRRKSRAAYRRWRASLSRLNTFLAERLTGIRIVKLFVVEKAGDRRHDRLSGEYKRHFLMQRRAWAVFRPVSTTLTAAAIGLVLAFGGAATLPGSSHPIPLGVLVAFLGYAQLFVTPIRDLTEKFDVVQGAMTAAERIFAIIDEEPEIRGGDGTLPATAKRGDVAFENVRFRYPRGTQALDGVSFHVPAGKTLAIVGRTGAGKSTIINLLCRFYDVDSGAVRIDGKDVRDLDLQRLRREIAVVHQDVFLFADTIVENIRLGNDKISEARVRDACRAVQADRFIERLPGGYHEVLAEGAKTLSAGERQLLSFARALVTDPTILVLDEATANVDTPTEERIQEAIRVLTRGRTSIVVAHRLSTIRNANEIIVMEAGRIVESGTHDELIALGGAYEKLYRHGFADEE